MTNGISRLQLLIDLNNRLGAGLNAARQQVERATGGMQGRLDAFSARNVQAFGALRDEVPGVGRAFELIGNPVVAAGAGIAALGYGIIKATDEAARFSGQFRQLQMLNLDKPTKDMGNLKKMIQDTSYEKGFDPTETTKAFFDVQSVTVKFGGEVDAIVSKQGEFARLMQADFKQWIAGSAKAMVNYGFGADKLDEFNKAAFATVQTGVTTFDELAQVQSMFAGAAAASKQSFASADKMFSIFTVKVKDVNEAATLTKSLFTDLTKQTTIDSFEKIGISVFDSNNQFKQADVLLLELQKKFRELGTSDSEMMRLKNMFTGSEGLINFVQAATDKTNTLQQTISTFDATQFQLPKALEIARNDINYINEQLENKTKVLMGEIGDKFLPMKNTFLQGVLDTMDGLGVLFSSGEKLVGKIQSKAANDVLSKFPGLASPTKLSDKAFEDMMGKVSSDLKVYQETANKNVGTKSADWIDYSINPKKWQGFQDYTYSGAAVTTLMDLTKQARLARSQMPEGLAATGDMAGVPVGDNTIKSGGSPVPAADAKTIGSGSQTKSTVINIESFVKGFSPASQAINGMNKDELERWMTEMFLRVVRSAETTM